MSASQQMSPLCLSVISMFACLSLSKSKHKHSFPALFTESMCVREGE